MIYVCLSCIVRKSSVVRDRVKVSLKVYRVYNMCRSILEVVSSIVLNLRLCRLTIGYIFPK